MNTKNLSRNEVVEASETSVSAAAAARLLGVNYDTYKVYAIKYDCFKTNQSLKGTEKKWDNQANGHGKKYLTSDILDGKHPQYSTNKLKHRLISEGLIEKKCVECGLTDVWNNKPITLQMDHINGINNDHRLDNLRILCPNCHSQTDTWCGRGKLRGGNKK